MWEMFDKIVCIHYLPNKGERWAKMTSEFERVGLLGSDRFQFEFTGGLLGDRLSAGGWKQRGVSRHCSCSCFLFVCLFLNFQLF